MLYPPHPNELLSSWIIRNSIVQGSDPMGWVYGFWGEWRAWTRDIDRHLPWQQTIELSRFSRLPPEEIQAMTLTPVITAIHGRVPDVCKSWEWVIPTGRRNRSVVSGLQFCPECLKEKGVYFPKDWRLSWHTQCPKHHIRLFDKCDKCAMPFSPHLIDFTSPHVYLCTRCGNDLRTMRAYPSPASALLLQQRIEDMLVSPDTITRYYPQWRLQTVKELFLFLRDLIVLSIVFSKNEERFEKWQGFLFGKVYFEPYYSRTGLTFDMRNIKERESLLLTAFHLLEHTPQYLIGSIQHIQITRSIFNRYNFPRSPQMDTILSSLPYKRVPKKKKRDISTVFSKEPKTVDEINRQMDAIRRFL